MSAVAHWFEVCYTIVSGCHILRNFSKKSACRKVNIALALIDQISAMCIEVGCMTFPWEPDVSQPTIVRLSR